MGAGHALATGPAAHAHSRRSARVLRDVPAQCTLVGTVLFVVVVVATPPTAYAAFAGYLAVIVALLAVIGAKPVRVLRRLSLEVPLVAFAVLLPFLAHGERIDVLGVGLSQPGLEAAFAILAKASLGLLSTVVLSETTTLPEVVRGLDRLRLPRQLVAIFGFMVRYSEVVRLDLARMKVARESRGYAPRNLLQTRALAAGFGSLFIRSYERGERVHLAMRSRGYTGVMPRLGNQSAPRGQWGLAMVWPLVGLLILVAAWPTR